MRQHALDAEFLKGPAATSRAKLLAKARKAGRVVLAEGESDQQTLAYHDFPALGLPGADTWKEVWADLFEGIARVDVVVETAVGAMKASGCTRGRVPSSSNSGTVSYNPSLVRIPTRRLTPG